MNNPTMIKERIERMRQVMKAQNVQAYIIPGGDAHLGEYVPERWTGRRYMSGFTGSAGTVVITADKAGLWTDSRYFLQGAEQIQGSGLELYKEEIPGFPTIEEFFVQELKKGERVAIDPQCYSWAAAQELEGYLHNFEIELVYSDLLDLVWTDRPQVPRNPFFEHPEKFAGEKTSLRLERIRKAIAAKGANATLITMLDELCWAFNIRGNDVDFNPVGVGFGYIGSDKAILFAYAEKVPEPLKKTLQQEGIEVQDYETYPEFLRTLGREERKIFVDRKRTSMLAYLCLSGQKASFVFGDSVITHMKSIKNEAEIAGVKRSMIRDGVALTRFFMWLEKALNSNEQVTEYSAGEKLTQFRAQQESYVCDSFDTICGYKGNGAIVHYRAQEDTANALEPRGILLVDSGAQYLDGTTDITRTIALGQVTDQQKQDYTLVLKGHIDLATAQFPQGTRGNQLDILARKALWDRGLHYGHGTGHGVGVFMNVHEGPQNFRMDNNPTPMSLHTFTSNEPGLYRAGMYGIRIENLVLTVEKSQTEFASFYGFETLTMCYLDNNLVDKKLLTLQEIEWYNNYQRQVYETLSPALNNEERAWLYNKTAPLV